MENEKKHLPVFGIGPILCFPMAIISAVAIFLSIKGIIPFVIENKVIKYIFIVLGIALIVEGLACFFGVDFGGGDDFVAQHGLYGPQVGAALEQMSGKGVA